MRFGVVCFRSRYIYFDVFCIFSIEGRGGVVLFFYFV